MTDSVSTMTTTLDGSGVAVGARVITKSMLDIIHNTRGAQTALAALDMQAARFGRGGTAAMAAMNAGVSQVHKSTTGLRHTLKTIEERIVRIGATIAVFAGLVAAVRLVGAAFREAFEYLSLMETAMLGIASSYLVVGKYMDEVTGKQMNAQKAFMLAQGDSRRAIDMLKVANLKTIATLDELVQGFQISLPVALRQGFDTKQVVDFTTAVYQMAGAIGQPFDQMSEEIRSLLGQANITKHSRMAQVLGLQAGTAIRKEFDKAKAAGADLYPFMMKLMKPFEMAGLESQKTWDGLISNIKDIGKIGLGLAFDDLFTKAKDTLMEIQDIFGKINNDTLAFDINPKFLEGAREVGRVLKETFGELRAAMTSGANQMFIGPLITELKLAGQAIYAVTKKIISLAAPIAAITTAFITFRLVLLAVKAAYGLSIAMSTAFVAALRNEAKTLAVLGMAKTAHVSTSAMALAVKEKELLVTAQQMTIDAADIKKTNDSIYMENKHSLALAQNVKFKQAGASATIYALKASAQYLAMKAREVAAIQASTAYRVAAAEVVLGLAIQEYQQGRAVEISLAKRVAAEKLLTAAKAADIKTTQASTHANMAAVAAQGKVILAERAVVAAKREHALEQVKFIAVDARADVAALKYNATLLRQGVLIGFVSAEQLRATQTKYWLATADTQAAIKAEAHTAALIHQAAALKAVSVMARITAASVSFMGKAFRAIGGWFTVVTVAIMAGMWAWEKYGNAVKKTQEKIDAGNAAIDDTNRRLIEQITQLQAAAKAQREYDAAIKGGATEAEARTAVTHQSMTEANLGSNLPEYTKKREEAKYLNMRLSEAKDELRSTIASQKKSDIETGDVYYGERNQALKDRIDKLTDLHQRVSRSVFELGTKANILAELEGGASYVTEDNGSEAQAKEALSRAKAYAELNKSYREKEMAGRKHDLNAQLEMEKTKFEAGLSSASAYHEEKRKLQLADNQMQIDFARKESEILLGSVEAKRLAEVMRNQGVEGAPLPPIEDAEAYLKLVGSQVRMEMEINTLIAERGKINAAVDGDKANAIRKEEKESAALSKARLVLDEKERALLIAGSKERMKTQVEIEKDKFDNHLIAAKEYYREVQKLQEDQIQSEIDATKFELERAISNVPKGAQTTESGEKAQIDALGKVYELQEKLIELTEKYKGVAVTANIRIANSFRDLEKVYEDLNNLSTEILGSREDAARLEVNSIENKDKMLRLETELAASLFDTEIARTTAAEKAIQTMTALSDYKIKLAIADDAFDDARRAAQGLDGYAKQKALELAAHNRTMDLNKAKFDYISKMEGDTTKIKIEAANEILRHDTEVKKSMLEEAVKYTDIAGSLFTSLAGAQNQSSKEGFEAAKMFNSAAVVMNTASAIMAQLTIPGPVGWAGAAAAAVEGLIQLSTIQSTTFEGGGSVTQPGNFSAGGAGGVGTVLGDPTAKSNSIGDSYDLLEDINADQYVELQNITKELKQMNSSFSGLASAMARANGQFDGSGFDLSGLGIVEASATELFAEVVKAIDYPIDKISEMLGDSMLGGLWDFASAPFKFLGEISNWFTSGLFGKTITTAEGSGINIGNTNLGNVMDGGETPVQSYQDIRTKKKSWFKTSYSYSTQYSEVDAIVQDMFDDVVSNLGNSLLAVAKGLGTDVQKVMDYSFDIGRIELKGLTGDEVSAKLAEVFSYAADRATESIFEDLVLMYQEVNEGAFDTLIRLMAQKFVVLDALAKTGNSLPPEKDIIGVSDALVKMAGGLEQFIELADNFYDTFTDDLHKFSDNAAYLKESLGGAIPDTREGYADLVGSIDVSASEDNQERYLLLLKLADAADEYYSQLEDGMNVYKDAFQTTTQGLMDLREGLSAGGVGWLTNIPTDYIDRVMKNIIGMGQGANTAHILLMAEELAEYYQTVKSLQDNYQQAFYSETELQVLNQERLTKALADVNIALPATKEAYRALVEIYAKSGSANKEQYFTMLDLSEAAAEYYSILEGASKSYKEMTLDAIAIQLAASNAMKNLSIGNLSILSPEDKYNQLKATFESQKGAALGGDLEAQKGLPALITEFLTVSKEYFGSSADYTTDYIEGMNILGILSGLTAGAETPLELIQKQIDGLTSLRTALTDGDLEKVNLLETQVALTIQTNELLASFREVLAGESLPSYDVGSDYISSDRTAKIHEGEMVIDRASAEALRRYGVRVQSSGGGDNKGVEERLDKVVAKLDGVERRLSNIDQKARLVANS